MKILLLAGGDSSEREVSLDSSRAILDSLKRQGHEVYALDPATGRSLLDMGGDLVEHDKPESKDIDRTTSPVDPAVLTWVLDGRGIGDAELVFIGLHGGMGENGVLQSLLELAGRKYTGSSMTASAIAMDKAVSKRLMKAENVLTPAWELYRSSDRLSIDEMVERVGRQFAFPVIVKPNDSGSTVGLTRVERLEELKAAFEKALEESKSVLVEKYIAGRELTVAILDDQPLPVVEIKPKNGLYDYEAKYTKGMSEYIVPAEIDETVASGMQQAAVRLYRAMGASGLARVDFMLAPSGDCYCLELNTLPGMTELSLSPMAAKSAGIDFDALVERIIRSAMKR